LGTLDPLFSGEVPKQPWWRDVIESMRLSRWDLVGPTFSVEAGGYLRNPMVSRIEAKFRKNYRSDTPIELLAYHHVSRPPVPGQLWEAPLEEFLRQNLTASPFRRVWIFDDHDRRTDLVFPPLADGEIRRGHRKSPKRGGRGA
jgi:hypothetical protein